MLYLFNSAFRSLYLTNVMNTLFLPAGYTNEYRYRRKPDSQIAPGLMEYLGQHKRAEACVVFVICFSQSETVRLSG